jgi:hypothetical protein
MAAVHHRRHRCSHSHIVDTDAITVMLPLRLPDGVLIVVLAVVNHRHGSSFTLPFSRLVVVLSAASGAMVSISCHIPFVQLIVMLSAGASSSASHHASASHGIPLVPVPPPASNSHCIPLIPRSLPLVMPPPLIVPLFWLVVMVFSTGASATAACTAITRPLLWLGGSAQNLPIFQIPYLTPKSVHTC